MGKRLLLLFAFIMVCINAEAATDSLQPEMEYQKSCVVLSEECQNDYDYQLYDHNALRAKQLRRQSNALMIGGLCGTMILGLGTIAGGALLAAESDTPLLFVFGGVGLCLAEAAIYANVIYPLAEQKAMEAERLTTYTAGNISHKFDNGSSLSSSVALFDNQHNNTQYLGMSLTYSF